MTRLDEHSKIQQVLLGKYAIQARHDYTWKWSAGYTSPAPWPRFAALIIKLAEHELLVGGSGVILTFSLDGRDLPTGLLTVNEGHYGSDGRWQVARRLKAMKLIKAATGAAAGELRLAGVTLYQYR